MGNTTGKSEIERHSEKLQKNDSSKSGTLKKNEKKVNKVGLDDFQIVRLLGEGNFGKVMQVKKKDDGKVYAMKILSKKKLVDADQLEHTVTERSLLQLSNHPFLVTLKFAFQTSDKLYMVMDFINGGELFFHLKKEKRFPEKRMQLYAAEIFLAVSHLHSLNVVYRDLKPENVLLDHEGHVKLADFGLSKILDQKSNRTHTFCGTPEYLAPEVILQEGHGKAVDWWSFGTLLFELMIGLPPFYDQDVQTMYSKILYSDLEIPDVISEEAQDLLARLLERNPKKRLGTQSSDDIKDHKFFKGLNWDDVYNRKYTPVFKPNVTDPLDTSYFDEEYTKRSLPKSVFGEGDKKLVDSKTQKAFEDFTFTESTMANLKKENGKLVFK